MRSGRRKTPVPSHPLHDPPIDLKCWRQNGNLDVTPVGTVFVCKANSASVVTRRSANAWWAARYICFELSLSAFLVPSSRSSEGNCSSKFVSRQSSYGVIVTRLQSSHFLRQSRKHRLEGKCIGETRLENDNGEPCDGRVKITQHRKRAVKEETHIVELAKFPQPLQVPSFLWFFLAETEDTGLKTSNSAFNFVSTIGEDKLYHLFSLFTMINQVSGGAF